jgi:Cu+-exporting ATPase
MGTGTDTAINSADITLMNSGLGSVVSALKLSTKTLKIIRINMGWALIYNVIGIANCSGWFVVTVVRSSCHGGK